MGNMSTLEDATPMPTQENSVITDPSQPVEKPINSKMKSKKRTSQSFRQKLQTLQARIKYREQVIKGMRNHLHKGTFPKRFKSIRPYPKMGFPESQVIVNAACQQVECLILDQMVLDEEKKLAEDQNSYQVMKEERKSELTQVPRKTISVVQLQQELADLQSKYTELADIQSKYTELCSKLNSKTVAVL